jgi:hypothetical protein
VRTRLRICLGAVIASAFACNAADSVRVTFRPGYPLHGVSEASAQVEVSRTSKGSYGEAEIDRYFTAIKSALAEIGPEKFCTFFAVDVSTVMIQIDLSGSARSLECTRGTGTNASSSPEERAFNRIVQLTLEQAQRTLTK